jgi:hypothetical protein
MYLGIMWIVAGLAALSSAALWGLLIRAVRSGRVPSRS